MDKSSRGLRGFLAGEHGGETALRLFLALTDLKLAEDSVPPNVDFVPGVFEVAQRAFAHLAEVTQ